MNLSDRDKRILKIAGPVLGGILLLFLLFNLFSGGGGEAASPPGPVLPSSPAPPPEVSPSPSASASPVVVFAGRDPFAIPSALASATLSPGAPTSPGTSPTSPGTSPTSSVSPTTSPSSPTGGNSQDFTGRTIVLIDVFSRSGEDMAQVTVNNDPYTVEEGERFARSFELVNVAGSCANFLYVEESFTLCTNAPK